MERKRKFEVLGTDIIFELNDSDDGTESKEEKELEQKIDISLFSLEKEKPEATFATFKEPNFLISRLKK